MKHWKITDKSTVLENPWNKINEYKVILPNGREGIYTVAEPKSQAVTIVAIDEIRQVVLITEERFPLIKDDGHTNESGTLRLPMGGAGHEGENPLDAAKAELQEETGYIASDWQEVGICAPMSGLSSEKAIVYLAQGLRQTNQHKQAEEAISEVRKLPLDKAVDAMMSQGVVDGQSAAALVMADRWLTSREFQ